jgi:hypothetical protein
MKKLLFLIILEKLVLGLIMQAKKYKMAICLSGLWQHWDLARNMIRHWESVFDDIEIDYFISTWDTTVYSEYEYNPKTDGCEIITFHIDEDSRFSSNKSKRAILKKVPVKPEHFINDFDGRLKDYQILPTMSISAFESRAINSPNVKRKYYQEWRVNLLKQKYELENNFVYDLVIFHRPDIVIKDDVFILLVDKFIRENNNKPKCIDNLIIYCDHPMNIASHAGAPVGFDYSGGDIFYAGKSSTMDIWSGLYRYVFMNTNFNMVKPAHSINSWYMRYAGLWDEFYLNSSNNSWWNDGYKMPRHLILSNFPYIRRGYKELGEKFFDSKWINNNWDKFKSLMGRYCSEE